MKQNLKSSTVIWVKW